MDSLATAPLSTLLPQPQGSPRLSSATSLNGRTRDLAWERKRIDETAEAFESQFLSLMFNNMFTDINSDGIFGGGQSEEMYRSFVSDEYGKAMAANGGIGLASSIRSELLRLQEIPEEAEASKSSKASPATRKLLQEQVMDDA